jgi:tetratricopeptide (TPR) repeat protein
VKRLFFLLLVACGGATAPFATSMASAERDVSAGRHAEAAAHFEEAASRATKDRDREHAEYMAALSHIRAGNVAKGAEILARIGKGNGEHAAEAALRLALLHEQTNDPNAPAELLAVAVRFPSTGSGHVALLKVLAHDDRAGDAATLAHIETLEKGPLGRSEHAETLAYQRALRLDRLGRTEEARNAYVKVAEAWPYPRGALFDDALWRASEADEKLGRYAAAIEDLEKMLAVRESSHFTGSYERPRFPPALLRVGVLYRDRVKDRAKAREAFRRAYADLPAGSVLRDDALWQEAELWEADNDKDTACRRLAQLVSDMPDSRYVPCALERCPKIARPASSKAPKSCHAYLVR